MILSIWHGLDLVLLFVRKLSLTRQSLSDIKMQSLLQLRSFSNTSKLSNCATLAVVIYVCFGILYISASPSELIKKHSQLANNNETRNEQKIRDEKSSAIQTYFDLWKNDSSPTKNSHLLKWEKHDVTLPTTDIDTSYVYTKFSIPRKVYEQKTTQGPQQFNKAFHMKDQDAVSASRSITIGRIPIEDNSASEINLNVPEGYDKYNRAVDLKRRIIDAKKLKSERFLNVITSTYTINPRHLFSSTISQEDSSRKSRKR